MIFNQRQLICTAGHVGCLSSTTVVSRGLVYLGISLGKAGGGKIRRKLNKRLKVGHFGQLGQLAEQIVQCIMGCAG